ncbi:MATE family efflux transporter [Kibdelosporangium philippinense]|uniref:MATE family efflux transporter n=1 Tax=Kibdelosporangium philippinense TaxID=211113 RepID=A0ABS8Z9L7_9PSEU|nr:MATE family efflux transporter [Kibdelosporangium philippinense]MCE7003213.1 MATE family efflux transporter [Kibdelosporangium philippinense]
MSAIVTVDRPSMVRRTASMAVSLVVGMTATGAALQLVAPAFLGHLGGHALYLQSIYIPFGFLSLAVSEGLTVAAQVSASAALRQDQLATVSGTLTALAAIGCGFFVLVSVIVFGASGLLQEILNVPAASAADLRSFLSAMLLGNAVALIPALASAVLRGFGRARDSAGIAVAQTVLIAGAIFGVQAVWGAGVLSVPIGFVVGSVPVGVVGWLMVRRTGIRFAPWWSWRPVLEPLRTVALPIVASFLVLSASSLGSLWLLRGSGPIEVAGFGLLQAIQAFLVVPAIAIGSATAITTALSGAKFEGLRILVRIALPAYVIIALSVAVLRIPLVHALSSDTAVRAATTDYLAVIGPSYLLFGLALAALTYLEQTGHAAGALVINVVFFGALFVVAAALGQPLHAETLILLTAIAYIPDCAGVLLYVRLVTRRSTT